MFRAGHELKTSQRILITRLDRIGDVVLSSPVFQALRQSFPQAWIAALVRNQTKEVVDGNPFIDEVIAYNKEGKQHSAWETIVFARGLRRKKFDTVINLHPTHRAHWISFLAGIPARIGYQKKSGWLLTHSIEDTKKEGLKHEAEYNFDLLRFLNVKVPSQPELFFPVTEKNRVAFEKCCQELGFEPYREPYAVLNPSASCPSKIWSAERFAKVGDELWERYRLRSVLIGSEADSRISEKVKSLMKQNPVDLTGKLTLGMLGACLKEARLLVSNDSGPVHIGVAVGTSVLSVFGRNQAGLSAKRWGPLGNRSSYVQKDVGCYFCLAHRCQIHFLCLEALRVDEVLDAIGKLERFFLPTSSVSVL